MLTYFGKAGGGHYKDLLVTSLLYRNSVTNQNLTAAHDKGCGWIWEFVNGGMGDATGTTGVAQANPS